MTRIFVCSPYAGDITQNTVLAEDICRDLIDAGYNPFAPHLFYPIVLIESDPEEREMGLRLAVDCVRGFDLVLVYSGRGISPGMRREIDEAKRLGKPIVYVEDAERVVEKVREVRS